MTTATLEVSEELLPKIQFIVEEFDFKSKEEFFLEAIRDKVLELQKKLFFKGSDKIAERLRERGRTEKDILGEFDKKIHLA